MTGEKVSAGKFVTHIDCVWGLLCSLSSIDKERNNISLFNVIEQINVPREAFSQNKQTKSMFVQMAHEIILLWRRRLHISILNNEMGADIKLSLVDPSGKVLKEILTPFKFEENVQRTRFRVRVDGFVVTAPGDYVYHVAIQRSGNDAFETAYTIPFQIVETKATT